MEEKPKFGQEWRQQRLDHALTNRIMLENQGTEELANAPYLQTRDFLDHGITSLTQDVLQNAEEEEKRLTADKLSVCRQLLKEIQDPPITTDRDDSQVPF